MPKIPTFTSKSIPTAQVGSIQSNIKIDPTKTIGGALASISGVAQDYYIKKRDNEEKLIAKKAVLELKSETDKIIQSQKDNISEEESISNYKQTFTPLLQNKLSTIQNRRVKKLVEQSIDLENSENIYHLKQNSFKAYEKESAKIYNEEIQAGAAKYKTETNEKLKEKHKNTLYETARLFNEEHMLGSNDLKKRIESIDSSLLLGDADSLIGTPGAVDKIKQLDKNINGSKLLSDEIFNNSIYNSYTQKIQSVAVKGDPNADYEEAERLLNELENFERYNGSKTISGKREAQFATLKQNILIEEIQHENLINKQGENKQFEDFAKDSKISLLKSITDKGMGIQTTLQDRLMANELEAEFDQMKNDYLSVNPQATLGDKKSFVRNLTSTLSNIYQDRKIERIRSISFTEDTFDIIAEKNQVMKDVKLLSQNNLDSATRKRYERIAKINGYVTTIKEKTEDGKSRDKKIGDIGAFLNNYLPILIRQVQATQIIE
jgi:hypothetical protein